MSETFIASLVTIALSTAASIFASILVFKANAKRAPSQNMRDDMETARIALEISETSTTKQLELAKRIHKLEKILEGRYYKVTVIFSLGEKPTVNQATIEAIPEVA